MSKNTRNKIIAKLERLDEYLRYLREIQKVNKKAFLNDFHFFGLAERYLQLAIEAIMDAGKLLLIEEGLEKPDQNQEVLSVLYAKKVIPKKVIEKLSGIANFRNILVHDYEKIDREIIYQKLQHNLEDFVYFKKSVLAYLKKKR